MIKSDKINYEQVTEIISDIQNRSNKDLVQVMDYLGEDFEETKNLIVELTKHLDNIENLYNSVLKEYKKRV